MEVIKYFIDHFFFSPEAKSWMIDQINHLHETKNFHKLKLGPKGPAALAKYIDEQPGRQLASLEPLEKYFNNPYKILPRVYQTLLSYEKKSGNDNAIV